MADRRVADGRGSVDEDAAAMRVAADGVTRELDGVAADGAGCDRELAERGDAAAFGAAPVRRRRHRAVAPDDGVGQRQVPPVLDSSPTRVAGDRTAGLIVADGS